MDLQTLFRVQLYNLSLFEQVVYRMGIFLVNVLFLLLLYEINFIALQETKVDVIKKVKGRITSIKS